MSFKKLKPKLVIKTKRLIVRPYKFSDFAAWKKACDQRLPKQNKFDQGKAPRHLTHRQGFNRWVKYRLQLQKKDLVYTFGVFDRNSSENYGTVDLAIVQRLRIQCANLGYAIHNHQWRKGYAKEASKAAVGLAFTQLKIHRVEAGAFPGNKASLAVAKGIGMKKEGVRKRFLYENGKWNDCIYHFITAETWGLKTIKPTQWQNLHLEGRKSGHHRS